MNAAATKNVRSGNHFHTIVSGCVEAAVAKFLPLTLRAYLHSVFFSVGLQKMLVLCNWVCNGCSRSHKLVTAASGTATLNSTFIY